MSSTVWLHDPDMPDVELNIHNCRICSTVVDNLNFMEFTNARVWDLPTQEYADTHQWNYTYNYRPMLAQAGGMGLTWHDLNGDRAGDHAPMLAQVLTNLLNRREQAVALNPANGWGRYDALIPRLADMVKMCATHPDFVLEVS